MTIAAKLAKDRGSAVACELFGLGRGGDYMRMNVRAGVTFWVIARLFLVTTLAAQTNTGGVKVTDELFNNLVINPSVDSIQEFKIQKLQYPAEFGRPHLQCEKSTRDAVESEDHFLALSERDVAPFLIAK